MHIKAYILLSYSNFVKKSNNIVLNINESHSCAKQTNFSDTAYATVINMNTMKGKKNAADKTSRQELSEGTPHGEHKTRTAVRCQVIHSYSGILLSVCKANQTSRLHLVSQEKGGFWEFNAMIYIWIQKF